MVMTRAACSLTRAKTLATTTTTTNTQVRWQANARNGVCCAQFDRRDIAMNKFVLGGLEGALHAYDARTLHPKKVGGGGRGACCCVALMCACVSRA